MALPWRIDRRAVSPINLGPGPPCGEARDVTISSPVDPAGCCPGCLDIDHQLLPVAPLLFFPGDFFACFVPGLNTAVSRLETHCFVQPGQKVEMIYLYRKAQKAKKEKAEREARRFAVELQSNPDADGAAPTHPERAAPADGAATTTPKEPAGDELSLAEKKQLRNYRWKLIIGLCGPFTLQGLDTTIIASALPYIATDFSTAPFRLPPSCPSLFSSNSTSFFGPTNPCRTALTVADEVRQLNWIISSFNLTSAAFLPIWAQLTDIFGRHTALQAAIIIMMVGSAICTGAPTSAFGVLLLGRALQGVGAAGVGIGVRTVLADRVSLADYALNWTIFSLVATFSFSIGPVIGGYLTQSSWRWCFAINLPVGVVAIFLVFVLLRKEMLGPQPLPELAGRNTSTHRGRLTARLSTLDIGGQMLFLWGLGLLSLALTWGGGTYSWGAAAVVAPLVIGAVLTLAWLVYEYAMAPGNFMARVFPVQRAMMPWELLSQRDIGLLFIINFALGAALFAVMYFMTLYFALVEGRSSSKAGIALLYVLPGLGGTSRRRNPSTL